jgi:hypothetical protein
MKRLYHYFFYKLFKYMLRTPNRVNAIEGAVALLSSIVLLYLVTFTMLCKRFNNFGPVSKNKTMVIVLLIGFLVYYFNLKYFKNKMESIDLEFTNESEQNKIVGSIFVIIIGIGSLGSMIAVGILFK